MQYLDLGFNPQLSDTNTLVTLDNLYYLNLAGTNLNDLSFLTSFKNLGEVNLSYNFLDNEDLKTLSQINHLDKLILSGNEISDYSILDPHKITYLDVSNQEIYDDNNTITEITDINGNKHQLNYHPGINEDTHIESDYKYVSNDGNYIYSGHIYHKK